MAKSRFVALGLAALAGLTAGFLVYGARFPSSCLDSYPPICSNMYGQALGDDWDQPVWWPTLVAGAITFLVVWALGELLARWRASRRPER